MKKTLKILSLTFFVSIATNTSCMTENPKLDITEKDISIKIIAENNETAKLVETEDPKVDTLIAKEVESTENAAITITPISKTESPQIDVEQELRLIKNNSPKEISIDTQKSIKMSKKMTRKMRRKERFAQKKALNKKPSFTSKIFQTIDNTFDKALQITKNIFTPKGFLMAAVAVTSAIGIASIGVYTGVAIGSTLLVKTSLNVLTLSVAPITWTVGWPIKFWL